MAKASRSNKKQPAFDPSELEDLIHSPAVGRGVGSHLIGSGGLSNMATVVTYVVTTELEPPDSVDVSTVVMPVPSELTTVDIPELSTVVRSNDLPQATPLLPARKMPERRLWMTENGDLVPEARVKRIRLAQDVINSAEECVYDTLWNAKLIQSDERESCRVVQAGYDYLVKRTRLARKTIQRIVAKLLEKDFIAIENRADIYQRISTTYRVFSYKAVLEKHVRRDRLYVAKMGPGFSYAKPLDEALQAASKQKPRLVTTPLTVDRSNATTVVSEDMTTMAPETTVTVVKMDEPTVVIMSPHLLDTEVLDNRASSSPAIAEALSSYGTTDDDVVTKLLEACRHYAPDCLESEIVHYIHEKGELIQRRESRVYNPIGFLMTAVPKCFSGEGLKKYREQEKANQEGADGRESSEQNAMERWRREQEASLSDPNVSEQEKHLIRLCLGLNSS